MDSGLEKNGVEREGSVVFLVVLDTRPRTNQSQDPLMGYIHTRSKVDLPVFVRNSLPGRERTKGLLERRED